MKTPFSSAEIKKLIEDKLNMEYHVKPCEASNKQLYKVIASIIVEHLKEKRHKFITKINSEGKKQVYYISMEFLMGRSLKTSIFNIGLEKEVEKALASYNIKLDSIFEEEPDAGLGNGGLGRLAACYMDAMATEEIPATGYSICYEYGIFKQQIIEGWQTELPDNWLPGGEIWLNASPDQSIEVKFDGEIEEKFEHNQHFLHHKNYSSVTAVPHDLYVAGYDSKGVSKLRLWAAKTSSFDMGLFNNGNYAHALGINNFAHAISKVLYPNDNHLEGKSLRLRQQYFMCAASIGDIVMRHMNTYGTLDNLHEKAAIHVNDTHPTLAIAELMRILLDDCGYSWEDAWSITTSTFAYTNHTVMAEALETWDKDLMERVLPRITSIIYEINRRYCSELLAQTGDEGLVSRLSIVNDNKIKMANLCVAGSHSVNGVSTLHSQIIKDDVFNDQYRLEPEKFKNVTNGIAYRRWLLQSNKGLTTLLEDTIGNGFKKNGSELSKLRKFSDDKAVLQKLAEIKHENKEYFARYIKNNTGISVNTNSIFDVQVKRLHEYKRQHLNILNVIAEYNYLLENPDADFVPKTYIFASKAAPGYYLAKQIIKLIWSVGEEIRKNPKISEKLNVVFLEDYRVTLSEILMPASEISEQISLAGTEASGTGNMKLMLGGALTIGTYDGANVEISQAVGMDNIFIFGMRAEEVNVRKHGYNPQSFYNSDSRIADAVNRMYHGINGSKFDDVANSLKFNDPYMVLADFDSYAKAQNDASNLYKDKIAWNKKSLMNISGAGVFSADRAVLEYAKNIWRL